MPFLNISYTIWDADQDASNIFIGFVSDVPISSEDAMTVAAGVWEIIKPLQNGTLRVMRFEISDYNPDADPADTLSDIEEAANFSFRTAQNGFSELGIPCFRENLFVNAGAGKEVDASQADVAAFISMMTTGYPLGGGNFLRHCDVHNDITTAYGSGKQAWRSHRKKRRKSWRT